MGLSGSPLSHDEKQHIHNVHVQLQEKKKLRVRQMQAVERQRALVQAQKYAGELKAAKSKLQKDLAGEQEIQAAQALQQLSGVFEQRQRGVGQAHADAAQVAETTRRQRLEQESRAVELAEMQALRFRDALSQVKAEKDAPRKALDQHKERRQAILTAEREKAADFGAQQQSKASAIKRAQDEAQVLEQERRRRQQHSLLDFRFSRVHEQPPSKPSVLQPAIDGPEHALVQDPAEAAAAYQFRCGL